MRNWSVALVLVVGALVGAGSPAVAEPVARSTTPMG